MSKEPRTSEGTRTSEESLTSAETVLAYRYDALLRAYPKAWRAERGDEMLGTLLDAAEPGRRRPSLRESASIVLQGMRERLDLRRRRTPRAVWSEGLRIGVLILLAQTFAAVLATVVYDSRDFQEFGYFVQDLAASPYLILQFAAAVLLGVTAVAAVVMGRTVVAAVLTGLWALAPAAFGQLPWQLVTASAVLAGLSLADRAAQRQRTSAVWLLAVPVVLLAWFGHHLLTGSYPSPVEVSVYPFALLLAVTVGVFSDPRLPIAAACLTVAFMLNETLHVPGPIHGGVITGVPMVHLRPLTVVFALIALVLLTIGQLRARRLARI